MIMRSPLLYVLLMAVVLYCLTLEVSVAEPATDIEWPSASVDDDDVSSTVEKRSGSHPHMNNLVFGRRSAGPTSLRRPDLSHSSPSSISSICQSLDRLRDSCRLLGQRQQQANSGAE